MVELIGRWLLWSITVFFIGLSIGANVSVLFFLGPLFCRAVIKIRVIGGKEKPE